jgi:putative CocE/NonD family hydrolase
MRPPAEPVPFGAIDERADQVMVSMRDGVRLATDVYLPEQPDHLPTVLIRLPYDKSGRFSFMPQASRLFNERSYAFVVQDVRGKVRSEGPQEPFVHEVADGWDTLEWISAQPWSNGIVGTFGDSYYGFTQWAAAASGHPALRAIVPRVT